MTHVSRWEAAARAPDSRGLDATATAYLTERHRRAMRMGVVPQIVLNLARYADDHAKRYESPIGEDGVLGGPWADALRAVRGLLDGECGGLDCGTMDGLICAMLEAEGFEP